MLHYLIPWPHQLRSEVSTILVLFLLFSHSGNVSQYLCEILGVARNVQDLLTLIGMSYFRIIVYVGHVVNLLFWLLFGN